MPKLCRGFNIPLKYPGEIAGVLAGFYRDIVQCIRRDFSLELRLCVCVCVCSNIFSETTGQLKPNCMWNLHGIGEEGLFKCSRRGPGHLLFFIIVNLRGGGRGSG